MSRFSWIVIREGHRGEVHAEAVAACGRVVYEIRVLYGGHNPRAGISRLAGPRMWHRVPARGKDKCVVIAGRQYARYVEERKRARGLLP